MTSPSPKAQVWSCPWQRRWISGGGSAVGCKYRRTILLLLASAVVAHGQPAKPVEDLPGLFLNRSSAVRSTDPRLTEPRTATKSEGRGKRNTSSDDLAAQRRIVGIAKEQLARARGQASAGGATCLRLNLLAGVDMTAVIERTAPTSRGYSLAGHISGMEEVSNVVLVVNGAVIVGDVWTPQGHYTIRTAGGGSYLIEKTDPAERKLLGEPIPPPVEDGVRGAERRSKNGPQAAGDGGEDDGSTVDIFVFWTPTARLNAGDLRNMLAFVDLAIAGANEAYLASDIQTRLNLVGATEVHYDYEGIPFSTNLLVDTHLRYLIEANDGQMTEVHDIRDAYSSDLVHLFVGPGEVDIHAGVAQLSGPFGVSVTRVGVFIHEVGHNMGLNHDAHQLVAYEGGEELRRAIERGEHDHLRLYGVGYVNQRAFDAGADAERRWQTVMAYSGQCYDSGFFCDWLLRFSNPRQRWPDDNGDPMGIAEEDAGLGEWPADASRAANETKRALANWRHRSARCQFDLSEEILEMPAYGGSATIEVSMSGGASCPWHAATNDAFVDVEVEGDRVVIRARANEGPVRWGVVSIAGQPVLLRQLSTVAVVSVCDRAPAVRQAIVDATGHADCGGVTAWDLVDIRALDLSDRGLASLGENDVQYLANLTELDLHDNEIGNISALAGLANLRTLGLRSNAVDDISTLSGLANLRHLDLSYNRIEDISALSALANLQSSFLYGNAIKDISPLSGLATLSYLGLSQNTIEDISPLSGLATLRSLDLGANVIMDISPLSGLATLRSLDLGANVIMDISPLSGLANLSWLDLTANAIVDISALVRNAGLGHGDFVELGGNSLNDESAGPHISALRARGVDVVFQPTLRVQDAAASEGEALMFHVRSAPAVDSDVRLHWWAYSPSYDDFFYVPPPFAEEGADYSSSQGEAVVVAGTTETTISVPTLRDTVLELAERLRLVVGYRSRDVGRTWLATGVIKDASSQDVPTSDVLSLNVAEIFAVLGEVVEYAVTVGDPALIEAYVDGGVLRIVPLGELPGETTVTVLARTASRSRELVVNLELTDAPARSWVKGWRLAIPEIEPAPTAQPAQIGRP